MRALSFYQLHLKASILLASWISCTSLEAQSPDELLKLLNKIDLRQISEGIQERAEQPDRLFYFPTFDEPATPAKWNFSYETVEFPSIDGTQLHGWFIQPHQKKPLGTVIFSHGNTGAIGHHIGYAIWLVEAGYQLFMYDYRGFGKSKGKLDRQGMIEDVSAAFQYVQSRRDVDASKLISLGHSLGGAKSITAIAQRPVKHLKAVIVDGAFASYQEMATLLAGDLGNSLISNHLSPKDYIHKISPTPLLVIHGDQDQIVPITQGKALFEKAKQPRTLFIVKEGKHENSFTIQNGANRKRLLEWLSSLD